MRKIVWLLVFLLFLLHQDFWFWDDRTLVFGFMPVGLFYHTVFSFAAGLIWLLASKYAWPYHIEQWADEFDTPAASAASGGSAPTQEQSE